MNKQMILVSSAFSLAIIAGLAQKASADETPDLPPTTTTTTTALCATYKSIINPVGPGCVPADTVPTIDTNVGDIFPLPQCEPNGPCNFPTTTSPTTSVPVDIGAPVTIEPDVPTSSPTLPQVINDHICAPGYKWLQFEDGSGKCDDGSYYGQAAPTSVPAPHTLAHKSGPARVAKGCRNEHYADGTSEVICDTNGTLPSVIPDTFDLVELPPYVIL